MAEPKGFLIVPVGFNPSDDVRAITVDVNDYLKVALEAGLTGSAVGAPKGRIVTLCGVNPDGDIRAIELDANDNVLMSLLGGSAWEILRSDGTDAEWDTLADVLEGAILTADGDILIRSGGVAQRLAKANDDEVLTLVSGVPAWVAASGGLTWVDRGDPDSVDWVASDLTLDEGWYTLDLSSVVTDGDAKLVLIRYMIRDNNLGWSFFLRTLGNVEVENVSSATCYVANTKMRGEFLVTCDEDQKVEYMSGTDMNDVELIVRGWFK